MYDYNINLQVSSHVEAVLLLTKLHVERHIEVGVSMDELDVTAAESKATYDEIKAFVLRRARRLTIRFGIMCGSTINSRFLISISHR